MTNCEMLKKIMGEAEEQGVSEKIIKMTLLTCATNYLAKILDILEERMPDTKEEDR